MVLIVVITCLFWILGIHGVAVIGTLIRPFWFQMIFLNAFAQINGFTCPYIANEIFYQWFVWVGGSGCMIGLVLLMRDIYLRVIILKRLERVHLYHLCLI